MSIKHLRLDKIYRSIAVVQQEYLHGPHTDVAVVAGWAFDLANALEELVDNLVEEDDEE